MNRSLSTCRHHRSRRVGAAVIAAFAVALSPLLTTGTANAGPTYPVMNTNEYPPDGVWFRNSPNDTDAIRVTGLGVYAGDRVTLDCTAPGTNVARRDGRVNTVWYQASNVTRPVVGGRANRGWINAHFVDDGTSAGQVAPSVPLCGGPAAAPAPAPFDENAETDHLLFDVPMSTFLDARAHNYHGDALNWSTDNCSVPGHPPLRDRPAGFDFTASCWRHDFGYRNYHDQVRFNKETKARIDQHFREDMNRVCNSYSGGLSNLGVECRGWARFYYEAVRRYGT